MIRLFAAAQLALILLASLAPGQKPPSIPDNVLFEANIEYSNPDNQHLQLNLARPKGSDSPQSAILCIHGVGFRAGKRESYEAQGLRLAE